MGQGALPIPEADLSGRNFGGRTAAGTFEQGYARCHWLAVHMEKYNSDRDNCSFHYHLQTILPLYLSAWRILFRIQ